MARARGGVSKEGGAQNVRGGEGLGKRNEAATPVAEEEKRERRMSVGVDSMSALSAGCRVRKSPPPGAEGKIGAARWMEARQPSFIRRTLLLSSSLLLSSRRRLGLLEGTLRTFATKQSSLLLGSASPYGLSEEGEAESSTFVVPLLMRQIVSFLPGLGKPGGSGALPIVGSASDVFCCPASVCSG